MRFSRIATSFRAGVFLLFLLFLPANITTFAQPADNANRRGETRERDRDDDKDFPWGLLGLLGLAGLLGLRKPKRDVYVDQRDMPPRDNPPRRP
jgi:MYXO-CTERM domain-containing protein